MPAMKIYLLVASLAISGCVCAQQNLKFRASFSTGASYPMGNIAIYEKNSENISGPAMLGFNARLDLNYYFNKGLGVALNFLSSRNSAADLGKEDLFYPSTALGGGSSTTSYSYSTKAWY